MVPTMTRVAAITFTVLLFATACGEDRTGISKSGAQWSGETTETRVCLGALTDAGQTPQKAVNECETACEDGAGPRTACGALALANLRVLTEELGAYARFIEPAQSPAEAFSAMKLEAEKVYGTQVDLRTFIDQFIGAIVKALRGIRTGVLHSVGGDAKTVVDIKELPLDPAVLSMLYPDAESFGLLGEWTEEELAGLGMVANSLLGIVDLVMAHNLDIDVNTNVPDFNGVHDILDFAIQILNDQPKMLLIDRPAQFADVRLETHSFLSLLAGRESDLENVAMATPGLLGYIEETFAAQKDSQTTLDDPSFIKLRDVDGDQTLSRGDNFVVKIQVNGEEVTLGLVYPISATLTGEIFQFLRDMNANLDGSGVPARIAPVFNSVVREFGALASAAQVGGLAIKFMPDALAIDQNTFFDQFTGVRSLFPFWYHDASTDGVNKNYFNDATASSGIEYYLAYEVEKEDDASHFQWWSNSDLTWDVSWYEATSVPGGFALDGVAPAPGYYLLWQDPAFAGLVNVNTDPFLTGNYGMSSDLSTGDEFIAPKNNRMTNAVMNAFIVWALD